VAQGFVDPNRVAIMGASYGGYLSLMCLGQAPNVFKLAIADAPVTQWEAYDTGYTERYMNTPQTNRRGYQQGSVMHYAAQFPDEPNRLLLVHGMIDENVHFCNTSLLISALIENNKPYELSLYPDERHGFRKWSSAMHNEMNRLLFIVRNL